MSYQQSVFTNSTLHRAIHPSQRHIKFSHQLSLQYGGIPTISAVSHPLAHLTCHGGRCSKKPVSGRQNGHPAMPLSWHAKYLPLRERLCYCQMGRRTLHARKKNPCSIDTFALSAVREGPPRYATACSPVQKSLDVKRTVPRPYLSRFKNKEPEKH